MNSRLPSTFQIRILKQRFAKLNPDIDPQEIDWSALVGKKENLDETIEDFKAEYPQYQWDNEPDYQAYVISDIKQQAKEYGLTVVTGREYTRLEKAAERAEKLEAQLKNNNTKTNPPTKPAEATATPAPSAPHNDLIDLIVEDVFRKPVIMLSERSHGKSTSLKTIVKRLREKHRGGAVIKVFDTSMSWYRHAPLEHRQFITTRSLRTGNWENLDNCIYEIGSLSENLRRQFVSSIVFQDYRKRYLSAYRAEGSDFKTIPYVIFVFEEANTYFDSFSLRQKGVFAQAMRDFVSTGRNYKASAFLVVTAEKGELSPTLRRRSRRLVGHVESDDDIIMLRRRSKKLGELAVTMEPFHWVYCAGRYTVGPFRILDEVTTTPKDYNLKGFPRTLEQFASPPPFF